MADNDNIKNIFSEALRDYEADADKHVWNRIEDELHPERRRMIFYWAAAAVLLMAVLIPFYFMRRSGDEKKLAGKTNEVIQNIQEIVPEKKPPLFTPQPPEGGVTSSKDGSASGTKSPSGLSRPMRGNLGVDKNEKPQNVVHKEKPTLEKADIMQPPDGATLASEYSKDERDVTPLPDTYFSNGISVSGEKITGTAASAEKPDSKAPLPELNAMNILLPALANPVKEQHIQPNTFFPETSPFIIPPPDYRGWLASANILSSSGLSAGGGDPFTFIIPNSGDKIPVYSTDTIINSIDRTTTWNQEVQQTSIGYIPVSMATVSYDTTYQIIQITDTIRTPDKEVTATPGEIRYGLPVMTGISFSYRLNKHWVVGTGLSYSILTAGQEISYSDNTYEKISSKLQYAGIPVHVAYYFINRKNLVTYVSAGSSLEWNIADRSTMVTTRKKPGEETTEVTDNNPKGSQLYLNIGGGAEYLITRKIAFYLQPSLTVFAIKPGNKYHPATGKKYLPSVQTGIRYHF